MALPPPSPASTCLVTGASSGIGVAIAEELARRGYGVTLVARREDRLREAAARIAAASGVRVEVAPCDLTDPGARRRLLDDVAGRGLAIEVLVNNAGFGATRPFAEIGPDRQVEMVRTNVEAVVDLTARLAPAMVERGSGGVLNVASTAAFQPLPLTTTYAATKAFVLSFSEGLAGELGPMGVTVTALCPGPVQTEFGSVAGVGDDAGRLPGVFWTGVDEVAKAGVDGLAAGRRVVVPGALNRAGAVAGRLVPHTVLVPLVRRMTPKPRR